MCYQLKILYPAKISFKNKNTFSGLQKLKEFNTNRSAQEMLIEVFQAKRKYQMENFICTKNEEPQKW